MAERFILHCDLNNFFASVECLGHPEYLDVPMAVCGSVEERHGIVLAKNERAKNSESKPPKRFGKLKSNARHSSLRRRITKNI